ncbi:rhodanese-like domain-containing protein [Halomarina litorea]|uniref:rhodanese-like domain-containing protein n=1 Tax=Halomarina litorea TaxID=2961595 RepID=UPI0020C3400B|nr:rhodanese-like domain-containing protein [Halomarina sp. BCD28]
MSQSIEPADSGAITKGYEQILAEANEAIHTYPIEEAVERYEKGDAVFVDVLDAPELRKNGQISRPVVHASRGMLEFHPDPESPSFVEELGDGSGLVFRCAVSGRSALAVQCAQEMGLHNVASVAGGFDA